MAHPRKSTSAWYDDRYPLNKWGLGVSSCKSPAYSPLGSRRCAQGHCTWQPIFSPCALNSSTSFPPVNGQRRQMCRQERYAWHLTATSCISPLTPQHTPFQPMTEETKGIPRVTVCDWISVSFTPGDTLTPTPEYFH